MDAVELHKRLSNIYNDPANVGSFGSIERLFKAARAANISVTRKQVKDYLATVPQYGQHRMQRTNFSRRKILSYGINWLWQLDLAEMRTFAKANNGYALLLVKVDTLSKVMNVAPLKDKTAQETLRGFMQIVAEVGVVPKNLFTDKGVEFLNTEFQAYCSEQGINHYTSNENKSGAAGAERAIRTLKGRIYRYLSSRTERPPNRYIDHLPEIVNSINHSKHRMIGMAPADVTKEHEDTIRDRLYPEEAVGRVIKPKFKVGDWVRRQIQYGYFHKGYWGDQYSEDLYKISKVLPTDPVTYKLVPLGLRDAPEYAGSFYEQQLVLHLDKPFRPTAPTAGLEVEAEEEEDEEHSPEAYTKQIKFNHDVT
jgi:transposase InsO family protein